MLKIFFYIWMWSFFVSFTPGLGGLSSIDTWWTAPQAFQKAILWSLLFEILGLGCGSGPLTGRYSPPLGGVLYFLRPGTTKMPFVAGLPIFGGKKRTLLDVALYALHLALLVRALTATQLGVEYFVPIIALLLLLGLTDKTLFLASRGEHFWTVLVCLSFVSDWVAGSKVVWLGVWM